MDFQTWARKHRSPAEAMAELAALVGVGPLPQHHDTGQDEAWVSRAVRLEAANLGITLMRNNVGVAFNESGQPVRFGLANDSAAMNKVLKSHDLIGFRPVKIEPQHVGMVIAQFVSRETKRPGWRYTGTAREQAQLKFLELVTAAGGDSAFSSGGGSFTKTRGWA